MSYCVSEKFMKRMDDIEKENKNLRVFKERTEEECGASAVMNALMDRIQELEEENKELKDRNNKQQVVIVNETIEKEKAQYQLEHWRTSSLPNLLGDLFDKMNSFIYRADVEEFECLRANYLGDD
jgi:anion-transporting  ArsA/GET3 family ATPase